MLVFFNVECAILFLFYFLPSSVLYRSIGLFGRFFVLLSFSCFIDKHSLRFIVFYTTKHCRVLSRFDCSLVFFVPFQFNGYFLLFTVRTLRIVTYFHRNGEKNTRTKFKSITFFLCLCTYTFNSEWILRRLSDKANKLCSELVFHYISLLRFHSSVSCWILDHKLIRNQSVTMVFQKLECLTVSQEERKKHPLEYLFFRFTSFHFNSDSLFIVSVYISVRMEFVYHWIEIIAKPQSFSQNRDCGFHRFIWSEVYLGISSQIQISFIDFDSIELEINDEK